MKGQGKHKPNGSEDASPSRAVGRRKRKGGLVEARHREREKYFAQKVKEIVAHRKWSLKQAARRPVPLSLLLGRTKTKPTVADDAPTKVEATYAWLLAELYHSTAKERSIVVSALMELEGLQPSTRKSRAHRTRERLKSFLIANTVHGRVSRYRDGLIYVRKLRAQYPGRRKVWISALRQQSFRDDEIDELMLLRKAETIACVIVAKEESLRLKTIQNHYSFFKKQLPKLGS